MRLFGKSQKKSRPCWSDGTLITPENTSEDGLRIKEGQSRERCKPTVSNEVKKDPKIIPYDAGTGSVLLVVNPITDRRVDIPRGARCRSLAWGGDYNDASVGEWYLINIQQCIKEGNLAGADAGWRNLVNSMQDRGVPFNLEYIPAEE